jgi:parallel beta-helix repeat protein
MLTRSEPSKSTVVDVGAPQASGTGPAVRAGARLWLPIVFGALLLSVIRAAEAATPLRTASEEGLVKVEAVAVHTFSRTQLRLTVLVDRSVEIDASDTALLSSQGDDQRIGLSKALSPERFKGQYVLELAAREEVEVMFDSRCLDQSHAAPANGTEYRIGKGPLPAFLVECLREGDEQSKLWERIRTSKEGRSWAESHPNPKPLPGPRVTATVRPAPFGKGQELVVSFGEKEMVLDHRSLLRPDRISQVTVSGNLIVWVEEHEAPVSGARPLEPAVICCARIEDNEERRVYLEHRSLLRPDRISQVTVSGDLVVWVEEHEAPASGARPLEPAVICCARIKGNEERRVYLEQGLLQPDRISGVSISGDTVRWTAHDTIGSHRHSVDVSSGAKSQQLSAKPPPEPTPKPAEESRRIGALAPVQEPARAPRELTVSADGGKDYRRIGEAMTVARAGDTVKVYPGIYEEAVLLKDGVRLAGTDADRCRIKALPGSKGVIVAESVSGVKVESLTLDAKGVITETGFPDGIRVVDSEVSVDTCTVADMNGCGIVVKGNKATATIKNNRFCKGKQHGIAFRGSARGSVEGNTCEQNAGCGILLCDPGTVATLKGNQCCKNDEHGIDFGGGAKGSAEGNTCEQNAGYGIIVDGSGTAAMLNNNRCRRDYYAGIKFQDGAHGSAEGNRCEENNQCGIWVEGLGTAPTLKANRCKNNGWGILSQNGATPRIGEDNIATDNQVEQIKIEP